MRVLVAMSGGVDSSVAAGLMREAGHEVFGITMRLRKEDPAHVPSGSSCCSPEDINDARFAAEALGIPHYVVDYQDLFREKVIEPFAMDYVNGLTPSPCVRCNDHVKFDPLLERGFQLGADLLVTGHYARLIDGALHKAVDAEKDQSYFLFGLKPSILDSIDFPLGSLHKSEVRDLAHKFGLPNADKRDSEDLCFVPQGDYRKVVEEVISSIPGGSMISAEGEILGTHSGVHNFTVGQRKGLGLSTGERLYVVGFEGPNVVVGPREDLLSTGVVLKDCNWFGEVPPSGEVKIRYRHDGVGCSIVWDGERAMVVFDKPQIAVAAGQAAVVYSGDRVLGGGWIERSCK